MWFVAGFVHVFVHGALSSARDALWGPKDCCVTPSCLRSLSEQIKEEEAVMEAAAAASVVSCLWLCIIKRHDGGGGGGI